MKRLSYIFMVISVFLAGGCRGLRELRNLTGCEYKVTTLTNANISGVDVQRIKKFEDLKFQDGATLTAALLRGVMPLNFTLNIEAKNPNTETAAMGRMEWIAFIDDVQIATGTNTNRVVIAGNGGTATIPLQIGADILQILSKSDQRSKILNFGLNLADAGNKPTRVSVKIRPSIQIAKRTVTSPTFFTVGYTFGKGK